MPWKRTFRLLVLSLLVLPGLDAWAGTLESYSLPAADYPGSHERQYKVYVPDVLPAAAPLVMALHGCRMDHDDVLRDWGLTAAADRYGFILVAPFVTDYDEPRTPNCWGFWLDGQRHAGRGEAEDLLRIAQAVEARHAVDPARRYIAGLSSGAAMSVAEAIAHNEYWAAAASVAGLPYGEDAQAVSFAVCPLSGARFHSVEQVAADMRAELDDPYPIPLLVVQNDNDCTVVQSAGRRLRDAHLKVFGSAPFGTPATTLAAQGRCFPVFGGNDYGCRREVFSADGNSASRSLVETLFYQGPLETPAADDEDRGHYWIGGEHGRDGNYALRQGPSHPDILWEFFARHPRNGATASDRPRVTIEGPNPLRLALGERFVDPGARAADERDGELAVGADCTVDTRRAGRYGCTYSTTNRRGKRSESIRTVLVEDPEVPAATCATVTASPGGHFFGGRAVIGGSLFLRALASGDRVDIGSLFQWLTPVTLHEGSPGQWFVRPTPLCSW
ncbi:extracellular catalytic domain type 1 short-chain-length polyhydroxyalkanoate depolymerase [Azotobacter beijerinckii]|uniref:extracellular catalytic domain type 1 short-chain-length polyhydroxyalkanoate depolymerase n=1 Tax=Azotobacter beijerinckii TaxID=170623 RepID=UPI002954656B|nr:PHB depolymerase family esterase [Azotobacter beijerinckii]MDV7211966.1 PHB depolymerase family esterase [Azotobacter beijerinckii]